MRVLSESEREAKKEYRFIKILELIFLALIINFSIYFILNIHKSNSIQITSIIKNIIPISGLFLIAIGVVGGTIYWRFYRIPPAIQDLLVPFYENLGYSTEKALFHTLKVNISANTYFKIKISLYRRISAESCLFQLESMRLPNALENKAQFESVSQRYLLSSDLKLQKFHTCCELSEIHPRSLLMIQAVEEMLKTGPKS